MWEMQRKNCDDLNGSIVNYDSAGRNPSQDNFPHSRAQASTDCERLLEPLFLFYAVTVINHGVSISVT